MKWRFNPQKFDEGGLLFMKTIQERHQDLEKLEEKNKVLNQQY
jgi:hypothetical protein